MKYFEVSAKTGFGIKEVFNKLYQDIYLLNVKLKNIPLNIDEKDLNKKYDNNDINEKKNNLNEKIFKMNILNKYYSL